MTSEYRVVWEIDIDADSPEEAAQKALHIQRNPGSIATVFETTPRCECGAYHRNETVTLDLLEETSRVH